MANLTTLFNRFVIPAQAGIQLSSSLPVVKRDPSSGVTRGSRRGDGEEASGAELSTVIPAQAGIQLNFLRDRYIKAGFELSLG